MPYNPKTVSQSITSGTQNSLSHLAEITLGVLRESCATKNSKNWQGVDHLLSHHPKIFNTKILSPFLPIHFPPLFQLTPKWIEDKNCEIHFGELFPTLKKFSIKSVRVLESANWSEYSRVLIWFFTLSMTFTELLRNEHSCLNNLGYESSAYLTLAARRAKMK